MTEPKLRYVEPRPRSESLIYSAISLHHSLLLQHAAAFCHLPLATYSSNRPETDLSIEFQVLMAM